MSAEAGELVHRLRPAAGEPAGALVLFHGRGADETDLLPLLEVLDPERRLMGLTPRAPLALQPGGAHWYAVQRIGYPDPRTFHATFPTVARWLDGLADGIGVPLERTVIGGFSQGAVMSYALGLGEGRAAPAGIIALSGFIPTVEGFSIDLSGREGFRVAVGHGTYDPVIGIEWGRHARERLEAAGVDLTWREAPMGHSIDPAFLEVLRGWLGETVRSAARP